MLQCSDCDSVKMFRDPPEGDGRCSVCHGTGLGGSLDAALLELADGTCEECCGSGQCSTCGGTGIIEEPEIKIAA